MNLMDKINSKKLQNIKTAEDFRLEYEARFGGNFETRKPFQFSIDPKYNLSRLLTPLAGTYIKRWCTYNEDRQCTELYMRSSLGEQYRKIFTEVWDAVHVHMPDSMGLDREAVECIASDLKTLWDGMQ